MSTIIIKDEIAACRMTALLWKELSIVSKYTKSEICTHLFGKLKHSCPCCEYAFQKSPEENRKYQTGVNCDKCPMFDFWSSRRTYGNFTCTNRDSPYSKWEEYDGLKQFEFELEFYASEISDLAYEAFEYWQAMKSMNITW